jgi:beta-lactamase class D
MTRKLERTDRPHGPRLGGAWKGRVMRVGRGVLGLAILAFVAIGPGRAMAASDPARGTNSSDASADAGIWIERPDWARFFTAGGVTGTIAVADERGGRDSNWVYDAARARMRFIPASTFKVPHALFALDAGAVRDEFQVFPWDSVSRAIRSWNRDQDLRSSMRNSVVWVYQRFAREIGEEREREYLEWIGYGNADPSGGVDHFWLDGPLRISATEQIAFLRRLYRNDLPFHVEHQRLVKDIMIAEAGRDYLLRVKTGWGARMKPQIGWWVGWVEWPDGPVFFALNIDMPRAAEDTPKREGIARAVLRSLDALPTRP